MEEMKIQELSQRITNLLDKEYEFLKGRIHTKETLSDYLTSSLREFVSVHTSEYYLKKYFN
jgi:hypothetical protein